MTKQFTVTYEKDVESGYWVATIDRAQGVSCVTQGRSLAQARQRIREALAAYLGSEKAAAAAVLVDDVSLPKTAKVVVGRALKARANLKAATDAAAQASVEAAKALVGAGLSLQDAAELLELSKQRVHQLVG